MSSEVHPFALAPDWRGASEPTVQNIDLEELSGHIRASAENSDKHLHALMGRNGYHVEIISWLELEVKQRLLQMDDKLHSVAAEVDKCAVMLHKSQNGNRASLLDVTPNDSLHKTLDSATSMHKTQSHVFRKQCSTISERRLANDLLSQRRSSTKRSSCSNTSALSAGGSHQEAGTLKVAANKIGSDSGSEASNSMGIESVVDFATGDQQPVTITLQRNGEEFSSNGLKASQTKAWDENSNYSGFSSEKPPSRQFSNRLESRLSLESQGHARHRRGHRIYNLNVDKTRLEEAAKLDEATGVQRIREQIWRFLDDVESSRAAAYNASALNAFLLLAFSWALMADVMDSDNGLDAAKPLVAPLDILVDVVCIIEFTIRFVVCPNRWHFCTSVHAWIDFLSGYPPLIIRGAVGWTLPEDDTFAKLTLICAVPILRLFKILRHFEQLRLLKHAFELAFESLPALLYMLLMITLLASGGVYTLEPRSNVPSMAEAIWLSIVTVATVGYGDVSPVTPGGKMCICALIILSVLYMAAPLGIIGGAFQEVWSDRDRILLMQRTRERLKKWGYSPEDIPLLFEMADVDGTGEVDIDEFADLIKNMKIGLAQERIAMLFNSFDSDGSGTISSDEFIKHIFPNHYLALHNEASGVSKRESDG